MPDKNRKVSINHLNLNVCVLWWVIFLPAGGVIPFYSVTVIWPHLLREKNLFTSSSSALICQCVITLLNPFVYSGRISTQNKYIYYSWVMLPLTIRGINLPANKCCLHGQLKKMTPALMAYCKFGHFARSTAVAAQSDLRSCLYIKEDTKLKEYVKHVPQISFISLMCKYRSEESENAQCLAFIQIVYWKKKSQIIIYTNLRCSLKTSFVKRAEAYFLRFTNLSSKFILNT